MKKRRNSFLLRLITAMLGLCMMLGTAVSGATMPPKHADFESLTAQTHRTVYDVLPSKGVDGFGEKDRA